MLWPALAWLAIVPLAIANGALRQSVLAPRLGLRLAQPLSGLLLIAAIAAVVWLLAGRLGSQRLPVWIAIGMAWAIATLGFECGLGILGGRTWAEMLAPYRFADYNIWPVVLAWVAVAPVAIACMRGRIAS